LIASQPKASLENQPANDDDVTQSQNEVLQRSYGEGAMNGEVFLTAKGSAGSRRLSAWVLIVMSPLSFGSRSTVAQVTNQSPANQTAQAQQDGSTKQAAGAGQESASHRYFTDVVLINQNGEKMRFYSDLIQGKVVIINSFFGTCQGICLPMNRNLEKVQQALGDHVGKDVHIISISVDPTVDTPASLKEYAKTFHARPGWYFMSGDKQNVEFALKKIGHFVSVREDQPNIIIIGNERTGLWKKAFGLAQSDELVKVVESVLNDQTPSK
jgi:protein SCO1/2